MKTPDERFESHVERIPESGDWIWTGRVDKNGYGRFEAAGKTWQAHRFSFEAAFGPIQGGLFVCHRCDVPACVNPSHLFLGTNLQNVADRDRKGRQACQSRIRTSKLNAEQVLAIRADPRRMRKIAADYGVSCTSISEIKSGRSWSSLPNPTTPEKDHG
ncbi:HNH endonuclease signature motif containing protein [Achromobacter marplatensis]|uniref:HNH endonuclease signature motif containing protein n=1 Tax=Achromobacter marplatensis TaxID=470868 RepID=UPI003C74F741